jgi:two-component system, NtrC family, response regulator HydG
MRSRSPVAPAHRIMRVLAVDDDDTFRFVIENRLRASGHFVDAVPDAEAAVERLTRRSFDVMLLDLGMPGLGGLELLRRLALNGLPCEVVVLTGQPDYDDCVEAMKLGAFHYLRKPMEPALIEEALRRALEHRGLRRENAALRRMLGPVISSSELVGEGPGIRDVLSLAERAAATDSRVVILGESGTGKGVVARRVHELSRRRQKPFLDVHCGAMAHELLESELFGHERGAFTGATAEKPGLFELADGGTLFLDEFADMSPEMQSKLLKVLDHGELRRVGGVRTITVDVRVIVATNRDVDELVRGRQLRADLLHRVDVIRIVLPALRERPEDVPLLVAHFMEHQKRHGLPEKKVTLQAMRVLQAYPWPGNVRELANTVERLMILTPGPTIDVSDLPENLRLQRASGVNSDDRYLPLAEVERRHITRVLQAAGGNITAAARRLEIDRMTLHRKLREWQRREAPVRSA